MEELQLKLSQKNKRIQFLESILKEKVPNFHLIDTLANAKEEMLEDMDQVDLKLKLESAQAKISELESYIANSGSVANPATPTKRNRPQTLESIEGSDSMIKSQLSLTESKEKVPEGAILSEALKKRIKEIEEIPASVSQELTFAVEKIEAENQSLQAKIAKLKSKFTSFITEFKKTAVRDLESLENVHKTLISKAVQEEKEDSSVLNVDLIKILSFLHIDNRRLKMELKSVKQEFKEKQDEWGDQREKLRDSLDAYGDKVNRLQRILNKFLQMHNREFDPIPGCKSTSSGGKVLDWNTFTDSFTTKEEDDVSVLVPESTYDLRFQNTKKTIKGNRKFSRK